MALTQDRATLRRDGRNLTLPVAADNRNDHEGARFVNVARGTFAFKQTGTVITRAHIGRVVKAVDDETVALVAAGATDLVAGIVRDVDADGVWVEF